MKEENKVKQIKKEISKIGLMLPGKISEQWHQCLKEGCKCMDKKNPQKHGPYNQLSFSFGGKSSTMNIKDKDLKNAEKCIGNYKKFQELNKELVFASIAEIRKSGLKKIK